jgi:tetratricopeptide (TPR) repeat protein
LKFGIYFWWMKYGLFIFIIGMTWHIGQAQKKNAESYFVAGEEALDQDKPNLAIAHFSECLRLDPYYMEAYHSRAIARESLGDIKGALTDYSIYVESRPNQSDALFSRAVLRYKLGQYLPAKEDFLLLLKLPSGETNKIFFRQTSEGVDQAFTMQGSNHSGELSYLALIEAKLKNYPQALLYIDSALNLNPKEPHYYVNRGIIKEHVLDTAGAMADYQKALAFDPADGQAIHNMAVIKRNRGEQNESEKLLDHAILQSPNLPNPYAARAYFRLHHKDLRGALEDYNKVIELNKDDEESWLYRGMVKERMKDNDGAFVDYTQAISLKIDYPRAWLVRAELLMKLKRYADAVEDYTVAITWFSNYGQAYYGRGLAEEQLGKLTEACDDMKVAEGMGIKIIPSIKQRLCSK